MESEAHLDFETYSEAGFRWDPEANKWRPLHGAPTGGRNKGLAVVGVSVYAEHPSTEVVTMSYSLPGDPNVYRWKPGDPPPVALFVWLSMGGLVKAHNSMFEFLIWHHVCVPKYGFPPFPLYQTRCSMATARVNALPGALGNLSSVLQLPTPKDKRGEALIKKFSIPRDPTKKDPSLRHLPTDYPEDFEAFQAYCDTDVRAETGVSDRIKPMTEDELLFWWVDQEINLRGLGVDRKGVRDCIAVLDQALERYGSECKQITGLEIGRLEALRGWIGAQGVNLHSMDADAISEALTRDNLPPLARRVLQLRQKCGSASVKKLYAMELSASSDDRIRNLIIHHGARTGRPTGEGAQPLNMPRDGPAIKWCDCGTPYGTHLTFCPNCGRPATDKVSKWSVAAVEYALQIMATRSLDVIEFYFGDALEVISGCLRGLFVAAPGKELIASDYSAIEAVVLAMLAGETWRIDAFRQKQPIYLLGASKITGRPLEFYLNYHEVNGEHHPDRQHIGKVSELACFAAETKVLTKRGYVDIVDVTALDFLWDGVQWVRSQGVIFKGYKDVLNLGGIKTTPNHLINCDGFWKEALQLVSCENTRYRALETALASLPLRASFLAIPGASELLKYVARVAPLRMESTPIIYVKAKVRGAILALKKQAACILKNITSMPQLFPTTSTVGAYATASQPQYLGAINLSLEATPTMGGAESRYTPRGRRAKPAFWNTLSLCQDGTTRVLNWIGRTVTRATNRGIFALLASLKTLRISDPFRICNVKLTDCVPVYDIAFAGPRNTFTVLSNEGPLLVHNCGFGGWINSYRAFGSTADDDTIKAQILAWRNASPNIVEFWGGQFRGKPWEPDAKQEYFGVEGNAIAAVLYPGTVFDYRGIKFFTRDDSLIIKLLSGRELTYNSVRLMAANKPFSRPGEYSLTYMTWNSNPKYGPMGWIPMETYGGRLTENIVQATAHDLLRHAILNLRAAGYPTVLHVYDEIICEVPEGTANLDQFENIMRTPPQWAADWPIDASGGWIGRRYRKG